MNDIRKILAISLKGRERIYSFLGRIYEKEIDLTLLKKYIINKKSFLKYRSVADLNHNLREGFMELYNYLNKLDERRLDEAVLELAVDYANLFLGVKYTRENRGIPHPSESVYLTGYMYQDERDRVLKIYLEEGLVKSPDFREPEDHISLEMYFMAHLCNKAIKSLNDGNIEDLRRSFKVQRTFLNNHILRWVPKLADDIIRHADTEFYKAVGKITKGFLDMEKEIIDDIAKHLGKVKR